jgi:glycosyltransferase involved in cell wall biosynthesis
MISKAKIDNFKIEKNKITIIIPAKDEEASLEIFLKNINLYKKFFKEIIVIDGRSKDKTIEVAKKNNCKVIEQKNLGYGDAIIKGASEVKTKYFIIFDADGSKDPVYLKRFIEKLRQKKTDIVFAERYGDGAGSYDDTYLTFFGNRIFTNLGKLFFNLDLNDILHTFFLCNTKKFNKINFKFKDFCFCVEFPIKIKKNNLSCAYIPTIEKKRLDGIPKVRSFVDGGKILIAMITLFLKS